MTSPSLLRRFCRSEFARHGLLVFAASMLVNIFNYVFHVVISRLLGVDQYGALSSIISALTLLTVPATIAAVVVVKYAAEFSAVGDADRLTALTRAVLRYGSLCGTLGALAVIACRGQTADFLHIANARALLATAAAVGVSLFLPIARGVLHGTQDFRPFAISNLLEGAGKVIVGTCLAASGFGLTGAVAGFAVGGAVSSAYTVWAIRRHVGPGRARFALHAGRLFQTTCGTALAILSITTLGFADMLLVKHYFPSELAGYYGAASLAGKMLYFVVGFVPTIVLPKATALTMRGDSPRPIFVQAACVTLGISALALGAFALVPGFIVSTLAGRAFVPAAAYLFPYGAAMTLLAATNLCINYRIALHRFDFAAPLVAVTIVEIVAIAHFHATIRQVILDVSLGNLAALLVALSPFPLRAPAVRIVAAPERERAA